MPLFVTATPIGHSDDITIRAKKLLMESPIIVGEERAETERFLKRLGRYPFPQIELLNEHSSEGDVRELAELCKMNDVVLISDCGTPGFCDPGVELNAACRRDGTVVIPVPGASSLMALLSVVGARFGEFHFAGFPPREELARAAWIAQWTKSSCAVVAMDTPYRLQKFVAELAAARPHRRALVAMDLTLPTERIEEGRLDQLATQFVIGTKGEFILCLYPDSTLHISQAASAQRASSSTRATPIHPARDQRPRTGAPRFERASNTRSENSNSERPRPKKK
jgi:16S rRNA (cytidine1402-2'-O)-methyltransferase